MSVRRQTANRLTLFRTCGTCGKQIVTTADTPWVRQVERDGKRQATTYFCSEGCFAASYKHIGWFDGKAEERRKLKDRNRDPEKERARHQAYQQAHREELREKARLRRLTNPGLSAISSGVLSSICLRLPRYQLALAPGVGAVGGGQAGVREAYQLAHREELR